MTKKQDFSAAPVFGVDDPVVKMLGTPYTVPRNMTKTYKEGPIETLEGVMSNDWRFLRFKDNLSRRGSEGPLVPNVDDLGRVYGNGVRSNLFGLRYVGGYPSIPATYPLYDNTFLREQKGLKNHFVEKWHENVFRAIARLFFSDFEAQMIRLRPGSSSMMPFYETDMAEKKNILAQALKNGPEAGKMMLKGNFTDPWIQFQIGGAYHTVYRRQSSDVVLLEGGVFRAKDRPVADLLFATTGGRQGRFEPTNRVLDSSMGKPLDFKIPEGFFRERNRTAMGGPLGLNGNLMPVAQAVRKSIYDRYGYTFHHTTRSALQQDVRQWKFCIAADVSNHDWFWPTWVATDVWAEELLNMGFADWWVELYKVRMRLPNYVTDVGPGEGNILIGDWRKPENKGGLPSGNSFTDLDGTMLMTSVYFIAQVTHTYPELIDQLGTVEAACGVLDRYMRGKLPICLKDKSDDALFGWTDTFFVPRAKKFLEMMADSSESAPEISPYMKVSYEHGGAFLGSVLLYPESMEMDKVSLIGNIVSLFVNKFSPEYGVQSAIPDRSRVRRPFPGLAWKSMVENYGNCPAYGIALELIEREWFDAFGGESFRHKMEKWLERDERKLAEHLKARSLAIPELTLIDMEVLTSVDKLDWKYSMSDVSPAIYALLSNGLPAEFSEEYLKKVRP